VSFAGLKVDIGLHVLSKNIPLEMKTRNLFNIGRIFYGTAITGLGVQTMGYHDFPYMAIPPNHSWIPVVVTYVIGILLALAGACIILSKGIGPTALWLGVVLLLIFCFYYVPYEFLATSNYMHLGEWDNAEKELALSAGAFIIAGNFSKQNEKFLPRLLPKLARFGVILFAVIITTFGIDHFLYAKDVAEYIPSWISNRLFWAYLAGTALLGSGLAITLNIKRQLAATLLGTMIFIWVVILHIPKAIAEHLTNMGSEITSALIALAYSGIALAIAGIVKNNRSSK
jgi:uncharacterized membrane protein